MNMVLGINGENLIKHWEELRLVVYPDGSGVPTGGWGHTGGGIKIGQKLSVDTAKTWFAMDTHEAITAINKLVTVPLTQNQFDALVSFVYNVGIEAFKSSTLLRLLNQKNYAGVPIQLVRWNHDNGKVVAGLTNRRNAEVILWKTK